MKPIVDRRGGGVDGGGHELLGRGLVDVVVFRVPVVAFRLRVRMVSKRVCANLITFGRTELRKIASKTRKTIF